MARRGRHRGSRGAKIPVISLAILGGQAAAAYMMGGGNWKAALGDFASFYTGYIPHVQKFDASRLVIGYVPWLAKRFLLPIARPRIAVRGLPISFS